MKINKTLSIVLTIAILISTFTIPAMAEENIKVVLNGSELSFDVPPQKVKDRVMVPMRKIFEELDATVDWDKDTKTVTGRKDDIVIVMQVDNPVITVNGKEITLDVPPQLIREKTLVPARAVAEGLKADVKWSEEAQTVIITKEEKQSNVNSNEPSVNTKRVGEDQYGYITIPSNWVNFIDSTAAQAGYKLVSFGNSNGSVIINLDYYVSPKSTPKQMAADMSERIKKQSATNVEVKETKINDMDAYQVAGYYEYDDTNLFAWFFYDKNNAIHYISAEGPVDEAAEAVVIVEKTYSLEK